MEKNENALGIESVCVCVFLCRLGFNVFLLLQLFLSSKTSQTPPIKKGDVLVSTFSVFYCSASFSFSAPGAKLRIPTVWLLSSGPLKEAIRRLLSLVINLPPSSLVQVLWAQKCCCFHSFLSKVLKSLQIIVWVEAKECVCVCSHRMYRRIENFCSVCLVSTVEWTEITFICGRGRNTGFWFLSEMTTLHQ